MILYTCMELLRQFTWAVGVLATKPVQPIQARFSPEQTYLPWTGNSKLLKAEENKTDYNLCD